VAEAQISGGWEGVTECCDGNLEGPFLVFAMGWLLSVGSLKLYVSFAEYRLFYRALLQKRSIILLILLTKATP